MSPSDYVVVERRHLYDTLKTLWVEARTCKDEMPDDLPQLWRVAHDASIAAMENLRMEDAPKENPTQGAGLKDNRR